MKPNYRDKKHLGGETWNNKIRDLFKVKLYTIRSETKKKERERKVREKERERERERTKSNRIMNSFLCL